MRIGIWDTDCLLERYINSHTHHGSEVRNEHLLLTELFGTAKSGMQLIGS
jgi:hypothetical protein